MKSLAAVLLSFFWATSLLGQGHSGSCTCGSPASSNGPWEIEHPDAAYVAAAVLQFDLWNRYLDAFVYRTGDGATGPNGVNEIMFLDRASASSKYGINLSREVFAITYMAPLSASGDFDACPRPPDAKCGPFTETDVILNSEFVRGFKPSGAPDFEDRGPALYSATALHELGHALGFHHNFQNLSVMNYYEDFAAQYLPASDTHEARAAYPSRARSLADLATYPFSFDPELTDYAATTPVAVQPLSLVPGSALRVRNLGIENVGSESASNVQLRIYLSVDSEITTADILVGTLVFTGMVGEGSFWDDGGSGRTFVIPGDVAAGTYFVGALITDGDGTVDSIVYNNSWVAPKPVTVSATGEQRRRSVRH